MHMSCSLTSRRVASGLQNSNHFLFRLVVDALPSKTFSQGTLLVSQAKRFLPPTRSSAQKVLLHAQQYNLASREIPFACPSCNTCYSPLCCSTPDCADKAQFAIQPALSSHILRVSLLHRLEGSGANGESSALCRRLTELSPASTD